MSLETKFAKAVYLVRNGPPKEGVSTDEKLKVYALYKQATEGDCTASQPWAVQVEARAKHDAWSALKGRTKEQAMQDYVDLTAAGDANFEQTAVDLGFKE
jgi:diazepam-binding inhibitor (GABA receptor modulating acyl-CoA-binding protein)